MTLMQFGEADRQRWDLPEWIRMHVLDISVADLTELSDRFNFEVDDWPEVLFGDIPLEQAGQPDAKPIRPKWAAQAWAWMTLRQNGHPVSWDEAGEVRWGWIRLRGDDVESGKDDESTPSQSSDPSTTTPSEMS